MKVTIYTINDCPFSKSEKEYLQANNIPFEEKNLETNRENLTEMLKVSDNFAGTPVTKVEKDNGEIMVLKGFTMEEFAKAMDLPVTGGVQVPSGAPVPSESTPDASTATPAPVVPPMTTPAASATPDSAPAAVTEMAPPTPAIESLSEPAISTESQAPAVTVPTPPQTEDMSAQAPAPTPEPTEAPVNPLEDQEVGPISLDPTTTTPAPAVPETPTAPPAMGEQNPPVTPASAPQGDTPKANDALNSVLQNLQSQVQGAPQKDSTTS